MNANPYRPPATNVADIVPILSQQDVLDFAGNEYYWQNWQAKLEGRSKWTGFNWAAMFFAVLWCLYRRMYGLAALVYIGSTVVAALFYLALAAVAFNLDEARIEVIATLVSLALVRIGFGLLANRIYLGRALKAAAIAETASGDERSNALKAAGGINETALWIGLGVSILINVLSRLL